jgi:hypothetical protein
LQIERHRNTKEKFSRSDIRWKYINLLLVQNLKGDIHVISGVATKNEYNEAKQRIARLDRCIRILERTIDMYEGKKQEIETVLIARQDIRNTRRTKISEMYQDAMNEKETKLKLNKLLELIDFIIEELKTNGLI